MKALKKGPKAMFGLQTDVFSFWCLTLSSTDNMPCFYLRLSILLSPISHVQQDHFWQRFGYVAEYRRFPLIRVKSNHDISGTRNFFSSCSLLSSFPSLDVDLDINDASDIAKCRESLTSRDTSSSRQISGDEVIGINMSGSIEARPIEDETEMQRREWIGVANKGRVPWNKGKQHNEETRERIKERTIEALKNPKVRQKMAERCRPQSVYVKNKIGASLKRVWSTRLKCKRSKTRFFRLWGESIAEVAKTGGPGQEALDWDSYEKKKEELGQRQLDKDAEKEKEKALAKMRSAEKKARVRATTMEIASKRKLREERKKRKEEIAEEKRKLRLERRDSKKRSILKARLSQIRQKISCGPKVSRQKGTVSPNSRALEKLDIELIKSESAQREVSLADQIRAAKTKKAESATTEAFKPQNLQPLTREP